MDDSQASMGASRSHSGTGSTVMMEGELVGGIGEEIDVEGLDDEVVEEGVDLHSVLMQDLQHSSTSSDSDSDDESNFEDLDNNWWGVVTHLEQPWPNLSQITY